jgi:hypothetical protein
MKKLTTEDFIEKAKSIHGDKYDYNKSVFLTTRKNVKIYCKYHGEFEQRAANHLIGNGCKKCHFENRKQDFLIRAKNIHGDKYDYSLVKYEHNEGKITILCKYHGEFEQTAYHHLNRKQGCPNCKSSVGENTVKKYLDDNKIKYIKQYRFNDCKNKQPLPFDFYLPDYNMCIEYDGEQHFKPHIFFGGDVGFELLKINDYIKENYCINNNIKLLRIKYDENVDQSLDRAFRIGQNKGVIEEVIDRLDEKFKK